MSVRTPSGLLALTALGAAALLAGLFVLLGRGGAERAAVPLAADEADIAAPPAPAPEVLVELVPAPRVELDVEWNEPTTVLWPCRVEVDVIQADYLPTAKDVAPVGTGRAARLSGRIVGPGDVGLPAEIQFIAGPNAGRVLRCDASGAFGAIDLYPGLDLVDVRGTGTTGARREVRMRQSAETVLNLGFGLLSAVQGKVVDRRGEPLRGAKVSFDGRETYAGEQGEFYLGGVAGGPCVVEVELKGYASLLTVVPVAAGRDVVAGQIVLTLGEATSISITTPTPVGGPGPTYVHVLPANDAHTVTKEGRPVQPTRYPWYKLNPIEVGSSSTVVIDDLPSEVVKVLGFRPGAVAREQIVNLRPGRVTPVSVQLQAAPLVTGVVTLDGTPMAGVLVSLEAPDRVRANLGYLTKPSAFLEAEIMPYLPPAQQSARTNQEGRYVLTAWSEVSGVRYLEARGPEGTWAGRLVQPGDERVDLALSSVELGDSKLVVAFPGRTQGLPLEVFVNGAPQDPVVLAPFADLELASLVSGRWRIMVTWNGEPVLEVPDFLLRGEEVLQAPLPLGAVEGQDEEAWRRAGRDWPF